MEAPATRDLHFSLYLKISLPSKWPIKCSYVLRNISGYVVEHVHSTSFPGSLIFYATRTENVTGIDNSNYFLAGKTACAFIMQTVFPADTTFAPHSLSRYFIVDCFQTKQMWELHSKDET